MLSDTALQSLNSIVADELAAGHSPTHALEALTLELETHYCTGEDFAFGTGRSPKGLDGHIMLCSSATAWQPAVNIYRELSGSGAHYNGMFGNGVMLRDDGAVRQLTQKDKPAAPIAEQVAVCLRILGCSQISLMPELAAVTRRHLSDILLRYPVLMHPAFLVPVAQPETEYTAIAWALARTPHGGLPRYSHFKSAEDGLDRELLQKLTAFAKHPCVRVAMTRAAHRVRQDSKDTSTRKREIRMGSETLVRALLALTGPRVQFVASVMELDELAHPPGPNVTPPRPFAAMVDKDPSLRGQLDPMLAASMAAASGMVHTAVVLGTLPHSMRAYEHDPHFIASIRARAPVLFGLDPLESSVGRALASSTMRRIFLGRQDEMGPAELTQNTQRLVQGLVASGFLYSQQDAAAFVRHVTIGRGRPNDTLPRADTTGAVAFLKAIESVGGFGETDTEALEALKVAHADVDQWPEHNVPYRDAWAKAIEVLQVERAMLSVLNRAAATATPSAASTPAGADVVAAPTRRRRAAV